MKYYKNSSDFVPKGYKFYGVVSGVWIWFRLYRGSYYKIGASYSPFNGFYAVVKKCYLDYEN